MTDCTWKSTPALGFTNLEDCVNFRGKLDLEKNIVDFFLLIKNIVDWIMAMERVFLAIKFVKFWLVGV